MKKLQDIIYNAENYGLIEAGKELFPKLGLSNFYTEEEIKTGISFFYAEIIKRRNNIQPHLIQACINSAGDAINSVSSWAYSGKKRGILLFGGSGTGKTTIALAYCNFINAVFDEDNQAGSSIIRMRRFHDFCGEQITASNLTAIYGTSSFENLSKSRCLLMDDIGREPKYYGDAHPAILETINYRYTNLMDTVITTNLNPDGLKSTYGTAAFDRLIELCAFVRLDGASFRH